MAETKSSSKSAPETTGQALADPDEVQAHGWLGVRNNPYPDEAFALTTGPDSPNDLDAAGRKIDPDVLKEQSRRDP
jgi:hypothetical protein